MVKDAVVGRMAPSISGPEVAACLAIMLEAPSMEEGEALCADTAFVRSVAELTSGRHQRDSVSSFRALRAMTKRRSAHAPTRIQSGEVDPGLPGNFVSLQSSASAGLPPVQLSFAVDNLTSAPNMLHRKSPQLK